VNRELARAREEVVNALLDAIALAEHLDPDDTERALARVLVLRDELEGAARRATNAQA